METVIQFQLHLACITQRSHLKMMRGSFNTFKVMLFPSGRVH